MRGRLLSTARADHVRQVHELPPEVDLALADPGDVEQVVHQPGHLLDLMLDHSRGPLELGIGRALDAEDLHGIADGGERAAQLVAQHREELILAAVGFLERAVQPGILHDHGGPVSEVLGQSELGRRVAASRGRRVAEGERTEPPLVGHERHGHQGAEVQLAHELEVPRTRGGGPHPGVGDFRHEVGLGPPAAPGRPGGPASCGAGRSDRPGRTALALAGSACAHPTRRMVASSATTSTKQKSARKGTARRARRFRVVS